MLTAARWLNQWYSIAYEQWTVKGAKGEDIDW
jgi:hypothetical protein